MVNGKEEHHYVNLNIIQQNIREKKRESPDTNESGASSNVSEEISTPASNDLGYFSQCEPSARSSIDSGGAQSILPDVKFKLASGDEHTSLSGLSFPTCSSLKSPTPTPRSYLSLSRVENRELDLSCHQSQPKGGKISNLDQKYEADCDDKSRFLTYKKDETFSKFLRRHLAHFQVQNENAKQALDLKQPEFDRMKAVQNESVSVENSDDHGHHEKTNDIPNCDEDVNVISVVNKVDFDHYTKCLEHEKTPITDESDSSSDAEAIENRYPLQNEITSSQQSMTKFHFPNSLESTVVTDSLDLHVAENNYGDVQTVNSISNEINSSILDEAANDPCNYTEGQSDEEALGSSFLSSFQHNHSSLHSLESLHSTSHSRSSSNSSISHVNQRLSENDKAAKSCCLARKSSTSSFDYPKEIALDRRIPIFRKKISKFLPPKIHKRTSSDSSVESYRPPEKVVTTFRELASENERSINVLSTFKANDPPPANTSNSLSLIELYRKPEMEKVTISNESCLDFFKPTESDSQCHEEAKSESDPSSQLSSDSFDKKCSTCMNCDLVDNTSQSEEDNNNACSYFLKESNHPVPMLQGSEICHIESPCSIQIPDSRRSCETLKCRQFKQKGGLCQCAHYKPCNKHCYEKKINRRQRKNFESFVEPQLFQVQHIVKTDVTNKVHENSNEKTFSTFKPKDEELSPPGEHIYMNIKIPQNEKFLMASSAENDIFQPSQGGILENENKDSENCESNTQKSCARSNAESSNITHTFLRKLHNNVQCSHCRHGPASEGGQSRLSCGTPKSSRKTYACSYQPQKLTQLCVGELLKHDVSNSFIFHFIKLISTGTALSLFRSKLIIYFLIYFIFLRFSFL